MNTLISRITEWAATKDDIRSAVLVGSQARKDYPADEWSDIDVSLFVTDLDPYLSSGDWLNEIGSVHLSVLGVSGFGGQTQWHAIFDDARDVEFALLPDSLMKMLVFMLQ